MRVWDALYFHPGEFKPDPQKPADWNRGAFLVEGPGHCTACISGLVSANPNAPIAASPVDLADAGGAFTFHATADDILLTVGSTGRSPPRA